MRRAMRYKASAGPPIHRLDYASKDCPDQIPGPSPVREVVEMLVGIGAAVVALLAILAIPVLLTRWD